MKNLKQSHPVAFWGCFAGTVVICGLLICLLVQGIAKSSTPISLQDAYTRYCHSNYATYSQEVDTLTVDTNPTNQKGAVVADAYTAIQNLNREYGFSDTLLQEMKAAETENWQTRENKKMLVMWNCHPTRGLEVVYYGK